MKTEGIRRRFERSEMKVVGLVSGGKDSCYAMMRCIDYGHEIIALANLLPLDDSVDELDSYMYQTVGHQIVISYSECMGLPLFRRRIRGFMRHHHLSYAVTPGDEVEDLFILLNEIKQQIPSITAVSSGAIASDYQRLRVENVCARLGLVSLAYLWKQDQTILLEEMIRKGIVAITVKVAAMGLNPANHLGKELADLQTQLLQMNELYGINVCGEGGEYETLTLDCPLFTNSRIVLDSSQVILQSFDSIAPVGILHPLNFHLEHKKEILPSNSHSEDIDIGSEGIGRIYEVHGDFVQNYMGNCQSASLASDFHSSKKLNMSFSTNKRDTFSIGCWVQFSSGSSEGLEEDMMAVLRRIESQLSERGFGWVNVLYIHLYISNMKQFALANEVYVRFITEKKCYLGVPSRSTIELPLMQVGLGNAYIEVLVANDPKKKVLHVQSISCWAPSCIGPYSQATLHKEVLYMAGQLGLDPPTMMLCPGGPAAEMEQALKNCEAVANSFNSSLASHAIIIVIYCSAALTCCGRGEIQSRMESFVRDKVDLSLKLSDPVFLYVLAPNLPKGALVEVKPLLHIAENGEDGVEPVVPETSSKLVADFWSCEVSELYESCCQICNTRGMICTALVSMTKDLAATICSGVAGNIPTSMEYSCEHWKAIAKGCIYFIDRVLCANGFSWGDLEYLRFYFTTDLSVTSDVLFLVFSEAFNESVGKSEAWFEVEPIFNLIPVLSSGRSASMGDLISCELLASKL